MLDGSTLYWLFNSLPDSAWADGNHAELVKLTRPSLKFTVSPEITNEILKNEMHEVR